MGKATTSDYKAKTAVRGEYVVYAEEVLGWTDLMAAIARVKTKLASYETMLEDVSIDGQIQLVASHDGVTFRLISNI